MKQSQILKRRNICFTILTIFFLSLGIQTNAQEIPILDRQLFFGNPEITGGQLSPDGQYLSFLKEYNGIMNIWLKKFDEPFEKARPLTNSQRPLGAYFWTSDSKNILYVKDNDGDENLNIFVVNPLEKVAEGQLPLTKNLTPQKDVTAQIYKVSRKNPDLLMIGLNDRDKAWHDLYSLRISTGELNLIYKNTYRITSYNFDWDDNLRIIMQTDEKGNTLFIRNDGKDTEAIYKTSVTENAYIAGWNEDNSKFYLVTNKGELNFSTLYLMDPKTKDLIKVESDPKNIVDFGSLQLNQATRKIMFTSYIDDKTRIYWKDKDLEAAYQFLSSKFSGREISLQSTTSDYKKFLVSVWGDKYASDSYFFNIETKELIHQYTPRPKLKEVEQYLAPMLPIKYKSSDGLEIPGYLTIPVGKENKNLPLVVLVHGGPKGPRDYWGYNPYAQLLANRGYAVLQPNFRASGGYGKMFLNAGDLQWGKLMQDDITWGVKHFISEGIVDAKKVAIMGGSYGGYATLAGLAFTPELYACGVDIVGPSNLFTLLESVPAYWEAGRAFLYGMTGDPNTEEGKKLITEASPLFHVNNIVKPLLIIQGANDPRVKQAESDQIVIALRDKGKAVTYLLADDEGHGFAKPVNNMAMMAEIEKFLAGILVGRYQKEMPDDVAKRLKELTVDISTVTYTPPVKVDLSSAFPKIDNAFKEETITLDVLLEIQGQRIPMATTRTTKQIGTNWIVKDETNSMMGLITDEIEYKSDFTPVKRTINQMGQNIEATLGTDKIKATMAGRNIEIPVNGIYLTDGPGFDLIIAGLPLVENYQLSFNMPDLMKMNLKQVNLKVEAQEVVSGKNCWKVNIVSVDNKNDFITLWINPVTKTAEKMQTVLPNMGNAKLTITRR